MAARIEGFLGDQNQVALGNEVAREVEVLKQQCLGQVGRTGSNNMLRIAGIIAMVIGVALMTLGGANPVSLIVGIGLTIVGFYTLMFADFLGDFLFGKRETNILPSITPELVLYAKSKGVALTPKNILEVRQQMRADQK
jgi:hypothetical protein